MEQLVTFMNNILVKDTQYGASTFALALGLRSVRERGGSWRAARRESSSWWGVTGGWGEFPMLVTPCFLSFPRPDPPDLMNGVLGAGLGEGAGLRKLLASHPIR